MNNNGSCNVLAPERRQAITWTNYNPILRRHMTSLGLHIDFVPRMVSSQTLIDHTDTFNIDLVEPVTHHARLLS